MWLLWMLYDGVEAPQTGTLDDTRGESDAGGGGTRDAARALPLRCAAAAAHCVCRRPLIQDPMQAPTSFYSYVYTSQFTPHNTGLW